MSTRAVATCDCGWTGGPYRSPAQATYAVVRHSCDKYAADQARAARVRARRTDPGARVECTCKVARHVHGTHAAYVVDRCRCRPCRDAAAAYERTRSRQRAYGRAAYIDAQPARDHVRALQAQGMGWKRIVAAAGLSNSVLWKLLYGDHTRSQQPSKRIRPATEARILAVTLDLGATVPVPGYGTRRRLQALVATGWSQTKLAGLLGMSVANFNPLIHGRDTTRVRHSTERAVTALYARLWDTPPPADTRGHRGAAKRSTALAARYGWAVPMAWDDDTIDDPDARPQHDLPDLPDAVDEAAVLRRIDGQHVRLTRAERHEVVRLLHVAGLNDGQIARRTGLVERTVLRDRRTLRLPAQPAHSTPHAIPHVTERKTA